jgi:hypothetical protein
MVYVALGNEKSETIQTEEHEYGLDRVQMMLAGIAGLVDEDFQNHNPTPHPKGQGISHEAPYPSPRVAASAASPRLTISAGAATAGVWPSPVAVPGSQVLR